MSEALLPLLPILRDGLDPVPELGLVRAERPVVQFQIPGGPTAWLVTRYDDVRTVLTDTRRFSNDIRNLAESDRAMFPPWRPGGLGFSDPPRHTRLRRLLTPEFTVRRLHRLQPRIEAIVDEHLATMERTGPPTDLVQAFALPIPLLVICELLGVPDSERADFRTISNGRFEFSGDAGTSLVAIEESLTYLAGLVARQREKPGDGLLGMLVREHGGDLDDRELAGLADGLLTGGHDTTASMLALGTLVLLRNPDHAALVRDRGDHIDQVVEELLRHVTVVQVAFPRFAREDVMLAGHRIPAGGTVICSLSAANRDEALGTDLDEVRPTREITAHLAFGHGVHHCIGARLARMEMRLAYPALLRRFPALRLAVPITDISFRSFSVVYGVESLPVTW